MGLGSRWTGGLVDRFGSRLPLAIGPALTAAGFVILGLSDSDPAYWSGVLPSGLLVVSTGMTIAVAPLTTTVLNAVPDGKSGTASGINNAAARTGGLLAVAALGLALGGGATEIDDDAVTRAYRLTMWAATALAALSGVIAALTDADQPNRRSLEAFLVAPDLERNRPGGSFQEADHGAGATPAAFFIESRRPFVADRAGKPRKLDPRCQKPSLRICQQRSRRAGTPCFRRDKQLIELITLDHTESSRLTELADDSNAVERCAKPSSEALQRADSRQLRRHDPRMGVLPSVVPNLCEAADLLGSGVSYFHLCAKDSPRLKGSRR